MSNIIQTEQFIYLEHKHTHTLSLQQQLIKKGGMNLKRIKGGYMWGSEGLRDGDIMQLN